MRWDGSEGGKSVEDIQDELERLCSWRDFRLFEVIDLSQVATTFQMMWIKVPVLRGGNGDPEEICVHVAV